MTSIYRKLLLATCCVAAMTGVVLAAPSDEPMALRGDILADQGSNVSPVAVPTPASTPAASPVSTPAAPAANSLGLMAPVVASAAELAKQPYWSWFKFNPAVQNTWKIDVDPNDSNIVRAKPHRLGLATPARKVLVAYPRASSAYDTSITKIFNVFEDKLLDAEITIVNFKLDDAKGKELLRMADNEGYDLVFSMGSEATAWLWNNYKNGKLPVVSVCSKDPVVLGQSPGYDLGSGTNFAFTSLNMPMDVQMAYVNDLKPKLRNIAILVDSKNLSAVETQSKPVIEYAKKRGIRVMELAVTDPANAQAELTKMVSAAAAQMQRNDPDLKNSLFWLTGSTSVFKEIDTINKHAGRIPVVAVVPEIVREGDNTAAVSIGISFESNAHLAAIYGVDILNGRAKAGTLRVGVVSPPDIALSFRKIRDIGMSVPLSMFEAAGTIYDYEGKAVRIDGANVVKKTN
jgi:putative tryptophan/tyrosine transport system substrate-binding protein